MTIICEYKRLYTQRICFDFSLNFTRLIKIFILTSSGSSGSVNVVSLLVLRLVGGRESGRKRFDWFEGLIQENLVTLKVQSLIDESLYLYN